MIKYVYLNRDILALLDCLSRSNAVVRASVVRHRPAASFLRKHQLNQCQILWKGSFSPHLQTISSFFQNGTNFQN